MDLNDNELVLAIKENPEQGFRLLMDRYKIPVYWHIRRLVVLHDDAQDAAQETFVRVFRNIDKFDNHCSFASWIYKIATNEALRLRKRRNHVQVYLDDTNSSAKNITASGYVDYNDLEAIKLQQAILTLPTRQQIAFNLRYYDELDYEEIAEIIDSTAVNVKANYHIAKEKIIRFMNVNN